MVRVVTKWNLRTTPSSGLSYPGPPGPPGPAGQAGADGEPGEDGQPRFTGHGAPGVIPSAQSGDLYLDIDTYTMYQFA